MLQAYFDPEVLCVDGETRLRVVIVSTSGRVLASSKANERSLLKDLLGCYFQYSQKVTSWEYSQSIFESMEQFKNKMGNSQFAHGVTSFETESAIQTLIKLRRNFSNPTYQSLWFQQFLLLHVRPLRPVHIVKFPIATTTMRSIVVFLRNLSNPTNCSVVAWQS